MRHGSQVAVLRPQKRQYWVQRQVTSETAITMHRGNNLLLALGDDLGAGRWSLRVQIRPLVSLVWLAAFIMALGGALAASDRRYHVAQAAQRAAADALGEPVR
jgi:cytochrome c-type biogenesis protein CcmF